MKKMQTGTYIEKARTQEDRSREWLAQEVDVATTTILRWEKGQLSPTFEQMLIVAKSLHRPISYFENGELETRDADIGSKVLRLSDFREALASIPDDIFEIAQRFDVKNAVWKSVKAVMKDAEKDLVDEATKKKKKA